MTKRRFPNNKRTRALVDDLSSFIMQTWNSNAFIKVTYPVARIAAKLFLKYIFDNPKVVDNIPVSLAAHFRLLLDRRYTRCPYHCTPIAKWFIDNQMRILLSFNPGKRIK